VLVNWVLTFFSWVFSSYYFNPCVIVLKRLCCLCQHFVSVCIGSSQLMQVASIMLCYLYHHLVSTCMEPLKGYMGIVCPGSSSSLSPNHLFLLYIHSSHYILQG
jgi:hypothetical protein